MTHLYYEMEIISKHILYLLGILDIRKALLYLNCTQCFSIPWLFTYMVCKSPNVPGFES